MRFSSLLLSLLLSAFSAVSFAQHQLSTSSYVVPQNIFSVKPQGLLFGVNAQLESRLSDRWSVQNEFYYRGWFERDIDMLAVASNLKWYFAGQVGNGFYLRLKAMAAKALNLEELDEYEWFAGGGIGIGLQRPISERWFYGFDLGVKVVPPLDKTYDGRTAFDSDNGQWGSKTVLSPTSVFDIAFSIGYRF